MEDLLSRGTQRLEEYHRFKQTHPDIPLDLALIPSSAAFNPRNCPQTHHFYHSRMKDTAYVRQRATGSQQFVRDQLDAAEKLRVEAQVLMKENSQLRQTICDQAQHFILMSTPL